MSERMQEATDKLYLLASQLDGIEDLRKATDNRFRQATRSTEDSDGETRGLGFDAGDPEIAAIRLTNEALGKIERQVILQLQRAMRRHPLGPWQKQALGVGEKQLARLLAATGDPYWNTLHDRPRTVSELWAYCGLHTLPISGHVTRDAQGQITGDRSQLPVSQRSADAHDLLADGAQTAAPFPGHIRLGTQTQTTRGAARRSKGQKANWSTVAKTRAYLIAESCVKQTRSRYREVYDKRRAITAERIHDRPCPQCNGAGHKDLEATPWRPGHQHADAMRIVSKRVLRDLWAASRDWRTVQK